MDSDQREREKPSDVAYTMCSRWCFQVCFSVVCPGSSKQHACLNITSIPGDMLVRPQMSRRDMCTHGLTTMRCTQQACKMNVLALSKRLIATTIKYLHEFPSRITIFGRERRKRVPWLHRNCAYATRICTVRNGLAFFLRAKQGMLGGGKREKRGACYVASGVSYE